MSSDLEGARHAAANKAFAQDEAGQSKRLADALAAHAKTFAIGVAPHQQTHDRDYDAAQIAFWHTEQAADELWNTTVAGEQAELWQTEYRVQASSLYAAPRVVEGSDWQDYIVDLSNAKNDWWTSFRATYDSWVASVNVQNRSQTWTTTNVFNNRGRTFADEELTRTIATATAAETRAKDLAQTQYDYFAAMWSPSESDLKEQAGAERDYLIAVATIERDAAMAALSGSTVATAAAIDAANAARTTRLENTKQAYRTDEVTANGLRKIGIATVNEAFVTDVAAANLAWTGATEAAQLAYDQGITVVDERHARTVALLDASYWRDEARTYHEQLVADFSTLPTTPPTPIAPATAWHVFAIDENGIKVVRVDAVSAAQETREATLAMADRVHDDAASVARLGYFTDLGQAQRDRDVALAGTEVTQAKIDALKNVQLFDADAYDPMRPLFPVKPQQYPWAVDEVLAEDYEVREWSVAGGYDPVKKLFKHPTPSEREEFVIPEWLRPYTGNRVHDEFTRQTDSWAGYVLAVADGNGGIYIDNNNGQQQTNQNQNGPSGTRPQVEDPVLRVNLRTPDIVHDFHTYFRDYAHLGGSVSQDAADMWIHFEAIGLSDKHTARAYRPASDEAVKHFEENTSEPADTASKLLARQAELAEKLEKLLDRGIEVADIAAFYQGMWKGFLEGLYGNVELVQGAYKLQQMSQRFGWHTAKWMFFEFYLSGQILRAQIQDSTGYDVIAMEEEVALKAADMSITALNKAKRAVELGWQIERLLEQHGAEFVQAVIQGDTAYFNEKLDYVSPALQETLAVAHLLLTELLIHLVDEVDAETLGRIAGLVLYEVVEEIAVDAALFAATAVTAGADLPVTGAAFAAHKAAKVTRIVNKLRQRLPGFIDSKVAHEVLDKLNASLVRLTRTITKYNICFVAGTKVHTPEGLRNIEDIAVGDFVLARDEHVPDGQVEPKQVRQTFKTIPGELYHVTVEQNDRCETIVCTGAHPFFVASRNEFVAAKELAVGDSLVSHGGVAGKIVAIREEVLSDLLTTYNFEVAEHHTYFVGESGVWVHNDGDFDCVGLARILERHLEAGTRPEDLFDVAFDFMRKEGMGPHEMHEHLRDVVELAYGAEDLKKLRQVIKAHDTGVEQARRLLLHLDELDPADLYLAQNVDLPRLREVDEWINPFEFHGAFGQGFDDIMMDADGNFWIVEYKGGAAKLADGQMERDWVERNIDRLLELADNPNAVLKAWSANDWRWRQMIEELQAQLEAGRVRGIVLSTPIEHHGGYRSCTASLES